tara:strand:+ start:738 stop:938 length:201 start_codon:yes stop_codon:yes gene_type:complete
MSQNCGQVRRVYKAAARTQPTAEEMLAIRQESLRLQKQAMALTEMTEESAPTQNISSITVIGQRPV